MKRRSGGQKGFTLIELSIVLVIIGIILAAVLKGQDLLVNAKAKQFTTSLQAWQIAVNNFMDLTKRLPGDQNANGVIGEGGSDNVTTDMTTLSSPPPTSIVLGNNTYSVYLGNDTGTTAGKNILLVCVDPTCTNAFNTEALKMAVSFASTIDNQDDVRGPNGAGANANARVYGVTTSPAGTITAAMGKVNGGVTGVTTAGSWLKATTTTGLVYLFQ